MQYLIRFLDFLTPYGTHSYFMMLGVLLACGFGLPMPEDIILVTGGILSARGVCDFWLTNLICMIGVLGGDGIVFMLGRHFGPQVKQTWLFRRVMTDKVDSKIVQVFAKYGDRVVFMGRFMPGLRMPIFLSAGIYRVPPWKFFALDGFAALISVPLWIWVGYVFGDNLEVLEKKIRQFQFGIYTLLILVLILIVGAFLTRRRIQKNSDSSPPAPQP